MRNRKMMEGIGAAADQLASLYGELEKGHEPSIAKIHQLVETLDTAAEMLEEQYL